MSVSSLNDDWVKCMSSRLAVGVVTCVVANRSTRPVAERVAERHTNMDHIDVTISRVYRGWSWLQRKH